MPQAGDGAQVTLRRIDERSQVADVAERWRAQYPAGSTTITGSTDLIYQKLLALDPNTATATDVADIIGNRTWAGGNTCDECNQVKDVLIELGQEPDYESSTANVCGDCLQKAIALIS